MVSWVNGIGVHAPHMFYLDTCEFLESLSSSDHSDICIVALCLRPRLGLLNLAQLLEASIIYSDDLRICYSAVVQ